MNATLRVRDEPFFLTGRGLAFTCEFVEGQLRIGSATAVTLGPAGDGVMEDMAVVEVVLNRSHGEAHEWPALVFSCQRGDARADRLARLLRPGVVLGVEALAAQSPIVIVGDDINMFDSLAAAQAYVEPPNVINGGKAGYDSTGRAIVSLVERRSCGELRDALFGLAKRVRLELSPDEPDPEKLRSALVQYLNRVRGGRALAPVGANMTLQEVIAAAYEYARTR